MNMTMDVNVLQSLEMIPKMVESEDMNTMVKDMVKQLEENLKHLTEALKPMQEAFNKIPVFPTLNPEQLKQAEQSSKLFKHWGISPDPIAPKPLYTITIDSVVGVIIKNKSDDELLHYAPPIAAEWELGNIIQGLIDDTFPDQDPDDSDDEEYESEEEDD